MAAADLSADYRAAFASNAVPPAVTKMLAEHEVMLVPGFLGGLVGALTAGGYFREAKEWVTGNGGRASIVPVASADSVASNAQTVAHAVGVANGPVVLVTHSKGCLDALHALLTTPALQAKVYAWVAIQGPFRGTPTAELQPGALGFVGGALPDMRRETRAAYLATHAAAIADLARSKPIVTYGSQARVGLTSPLCPVQAAMEMVGGVPVGPNDGVVERDSTRLAGVPFILDDDVDHGRTVIAFPTFPAFDRARFMRALLTVAAGLASQ